VAEAHEGFLDIVDTPGWSTTFRIFLPLQQTAQPGVHPGGHPAATSMTA
jgi:signal transduction histidine kinase